MNTNARKTKQVMLSALAMASVASAANADIVYSEDFESGLSLWTGKQGGAHSGLIVSDPLDGFDNVLSFTGLVGGGDLFTKDLIELEADQSYRISFDYLGLPTHLTRDNDSGGYVGFSGSNTRSHSWHWATGSASGAKDVLVDDGQWRSYHFDFTTADLGLGTSVRLMLEDYSGSGGVSGDAFFDNLEIATVPAPTTALLLGIGGTLAIRRRR